MVLDTMRVGISDRSLDGKVVNIHWDSADDQSKIHYY